MTAPAWYVIGKPWSRWFDLLHWPFSLWHLSYVVIGASLADQISWPLLGWTLLAFFLGMGVAAHAFDLHHGDPLRLGLPRPALVAVGATAVGAAAAIGVYQMVEGNVSPLLFYFIPIGVFLAVGYGLEWPGLHGDLQFPLWWAVFPLLVGYLAQGIDFSPALAPLAVLAFASAYAQRVLSTQARYLRRQVGRLDIYPKGGVRQPLDGYHRMLSAFDHGLIWMTAMMVALAVGMVLWRLYG